MSARAYERLADRLREQILTGALRHGERLPAEATLARQEGFSRSTVREALRTLQEAGYVERPSPRVLVVSRPGDPARHELAQALRRRRVTFRHLYEALLVLEPELTRLATERADAADVRRLAANLEAQARSLEHFEEWNRLDQEFHLQIASLAGNPALVVARAPITELLLPTLHRFMRSPSLTTHALRYHRRMLEEIEAGDPDTAAAVTRRHINDFRAAWEKAGLDLDAQVAGPAAEGGRPLSAAG